MTMEQGAAQRVSSTASRGPNTERVWGWGGWRERVKGWPRPYDQPTTQGQISYRLKRNSPRSSPDRCCILRKHTRTKQATRSALADNHHPQPTARSTTLHHNHHNHVRSLRARKVRPPTPPSPSPKTPNLTPPPPPDKTTTPSPPSPPKSPPCAASPSTSTTMRATSTSSTTPPSPSPT